MKPTKLILEAVEDGVDGFKFLNLLQNYGGWARYFGATGYLGGSTKTSYVMDDDTALFIDRAMQKLKDARPKVYRLVAWYYVNGLDEGDILSIMKQKPRRLTAKRRKDWYAATVYDCQAARYLNQKDVRRLIVLGEKAVFGYLKDMVEAEQCED